MRQKRMVFKCPIPLPRLDPKPVICLWAPDYLIKSEVERASPQIGFFSGTQVDRHSLTGRG
jgi:hypothetical protein